MGDLRGSPPFWWMISLLELTFTIGFLFVDRIESWIWFLIIFVGGGTSFLFILLTYFVTLILLAFIVIGALCERWTPPRSVPAEEAATALGRVPSTLFKLARLTYRDWLSCIFSYFDWRSFSLDARWICSRILSKGFLPLWCAVCSGLLFCRLGSFPASFSAGSRVWQFSGESNPFRLGAFPPPGLILLL